MRALLLACPPGLFFSISNVLSPSQEPYTDAANPAGPAPIIITSYISAEAVCWSPVRAASSGNEGSLIKEPSFNTTKGNSVLDIPALITYCSASSLLSISIHKNGIKLPERNSFKRCDLGDH